ncbi:MAG TPA: ester cyclase [Terracidiphilus sp.]|nr:ester cyclase [Terracidiphilus sp.]
MKKVIGILLLAIAPAWAVTKPAPALPSRATLAQQEQNKAIARRVFDEIFNQGKFQVADEIYAKDFVNHGTHRDADLAADQAAVHIEKQACPDLTIAIGPMVAEEDLVSVLWVAHGTDTARVGWLPATGAKIEVRGVTIWRIADGRIREEWTAFDEMTVAREVVSQLRWQLFGFFCALVFLLWLAYWLIGKLFIRRQAHGRAWDSRG